MLPQPLHTEPLPYTWASAPRSLCCTGWSNSSTSHWGTQGSGKRTPRALPRWMVPPGKDGIGPFWLPRGAWPCSSYCPRKHSKPPSAAGAGPVSGGRCEGTPACWPCPLPDQSSAVTHIHLLLAVCTERAWSLLPHTRLLSTYCSPNEALLGVRTLPSASCSSSISAIPPQPQEIPTRQLRKLSHREETPMRPRGDPHETHSPGTEWATGSGRRAWRL